MKRRILLKNEDVVSNLLDCCARISNNSDFIGSFFGFYFENNHEYMEVDLTDNYDRLDDIINYIKNRDMSDLIYYYFDVEFDDCCYVFSKYKELSNISVDKAINKIRPDMRFQNEYDILIKIDPNWYDRWSVNFINTKYLDYETGIY